MTWTRRKFVGTSALGLVAASFPRALVAALRPDGPFVELRRNVGTFTGRGGTMGWLANEGGALVVDSQFPDTARDFVGGFAERRGAPAIDALVNTHHHGDHTGGNAEFRDSARHIVAHARAVELQRRVAESNPSAPPQVFADTTFDREWSADIGDETVRVRHYGPAHTGGDSTVFFERANVVHMGDLVFNRAYPVIDRNGGASVDGWATMLGLVAAEHDADTIYVFGHAGRGYGVTGARADVLIQRDFLLAALDAAREAIAAGRSRDETTARQTLAGFEEHTALNERLNLGAVLGVAWDELTGA
jgi:cyclase